MLKAQNISYSVDGKLLLDHVSLAFQPGQMNLIIGPNGAGKSTLMRVLSGMAKSYTGNVSYNGKDIGNMTEGAMATTRAVLSQNIEVAFPMQVHEIVMMGRYPHFKQAHTKTDIDICEEAMSLFDIQQMRDRNYMTLSEKQRVHFARVCAQIWDTGQQGFRYLLLDEPLTFLDVYHQIDFMDKVTAMLRNKRLVVAGVVHDLNLTIKYADNIILLHEGKILDQGSREKVLTQQNIKTAFRIEPQILVDDLNNIFHLRF